MRNEAEQVFARWLGSLVPHTARAYRDGWKRVERITGRSDIGAWALEDESGTQKVLQSAIGGAPSAGYRNRLRAGFRSYLLFAKSAGLIEWEWTSAYEHVTPTRDSHGPSLDVVRRLFRHTVSGCRGVVHRHRRKLEGPPHPLDGTPTTAGDQGAGR